MLVDAFVLPLPERSMGVVFWERTKRAPKGSRRAAAPPDTLGVNVYSPGTLSPGEQNELCAALMASIGQEIGGAAAISGDRWRLVIWWIAGVLTALLLALNALQYGPAYSVMALCVVGCTLPWGTFGGAFRVPGAAAHAARLARSGGGAHVIVGEDVRLQERLAAVWAFAQRQRGSEDEKVRALGQFCQEQSWLAAAQAYATRRAPDATPPSRAWFPFLRRSVDRRLHRAISVVEMRAWR